MLGETRTPQAMGSDHCPAMKGIETLEGREIVHRLGDRSDHCPAMKGIETSLKSSPKDGVWKGSDHCPAMKGIETASAAGGGDY